MIQTIRKSKKQRIHKEFANIESNNIELSTIKDKQMNLISMINK